MPAAGTRVPHAEVPEPAMVPFVLPEGNAQLPAKCEPAADWRYQRNSTLVSGLRMPPLGSNRREEAYLELLERWITSLAPEAPAAADAGTPDAGAPRAERGVSRARDSGRP